MVRCAAVTVSHWSMPDNWSRKRSKLNLILISVVYGRYVSVCFTTFFLYRTMDGSFESMRRSAAAVSKVALDAVKS